MTSAANGPEAGFTLLEVLVALAVLAVGAVSLLTATQTHVTRISDIENRTVARWVADNRLAALRIGVQQPDVVEMLGQSWDVGVTRMETLDLDLQRVDVAVALSSENRNLFTLTGFIDTAGDGAQVPQ
ncbi:type II secretion system minor pseudopilin GspI [Roseobacter sp. GAI101]|uniref:type II secretion system minor pseudopilin GspI n=1 Tax=Roseobacter sp. (strain GAI101) TaxID=391589 RepID=UPI0001871D3A|nr:type II secretion system minor pseudopilin GspI [Roseobacter sp. GAI101]EEB83720.1 general secretion pathway protein I [Roseobacter sp. GAI101]